MDNSTIYVLSVFAFSFLGCSDSTAPVPTPRVKIGDSFQGGIVFYLDSTGQHGLIAKSLDQGTSVWGWYGTLIKGANSSAFGSGKQNTIDIIGDESDNSIGIYAYYFLQPQGITRLEWYIPSKDELYQLYKSQYLAGIDKLNLKPDIYWSSTQHDEDSAWSQRIDIYPHSEVTPVLAQPGKSPKSTANRVRTIRSF